MDRQAQDASLAHLRTEMARLDVRVRRLVRRWELAGQDPRDAFRGLYLSGEQVGGLLAQSFGGNWGQLVALPPDEARALDEAEAQAEREAASMIEAAESEGCPLRLAQLAAAFGLDRFEVDAFTICLAPALDLRYERVYGYLQDDVTRRRPTLNLILDLLDEPGAERMTRLARSAEDAPLLAHGLLRRLPGSGTDLPPLLAQQLIPDEAVVAWLLGEYHAHGELGPHAVLSQPDEDEADALLSGGPERWQALARQIAAPDAPPIVALTGPDRAGQRAAARLCAARAGRTLLTVDLDRVVEGGASAGDAVRLALRDARLTGAIPFLSGWDVCLGEDGQGRPPPDVLGRLCAYPDLAIVASEKVWQPGGIDRQRALIWHEFPVPGYVQRRALWAHYLRQARVEPSTADGVDAATVAALADQFALTSGQIRDAVASARDAATQAGHPVASVDLYAAARAYSNPRLSGLARKIVPRYGWSDIVLPEDQLTQLREIVDTVRGRPQVLGDWGVGVKLASSNGVTVLFSGPPGTGKTMAAEVIANELGLDLYKIDLSTVVSKYIGETEKNLERIFSEAQSSNAILFFDEADAIFGKRSEVKDAHDRYANVEISYLLQRMEIYDGVAILATNLRANLDEAFTRRLQFAVHFPFPEEEYRLRIWRTLFPPDVPCEADLDLALLARRFRLAGGNIRNILVSAAYLAAADGKAVTMGHLLHGTRRELQKMGRLVHEADMRFGGQE